MIGIVVSRADPASVRIGDALLERRAWTAHVDAERSAAAGGGTVHRSGHFELRTFEALHLELEGVAAAFPDPSAVVFVSRHSGETGPLLSAHFPGNVGEAAYGGSPRELPRAAPRVLRELHAALGETAPPSYDVGIECTHHGPSRVGAPCLFAELGSDEAQWADRAGADAVAEAVLSISDGAPHAERTIVGFGGGHYAPRFERILRETAWCVGHIAADWSLAELGDGPERRAVVAAVFERSDTTLAILDGTDPDLARTIEALGYRVVSETWLREADGVPLDVVAAAESLLGPVAAGTRLGEPTAVDPNRLRRVDLPPALVEDVQGIDRDAARRAVANTAVAYGTDEGGTRLAGSLVLPAGRTRRDAIAALVPILESRYLDVELTADALVVTERGFDPAAARALGVPEGPAFGRLADGQPVEVDGREVRPAEVTRTEQRRIPLSQS